MKGMKVRLLKKLTFFPTINPLKFPKQDFQAPPLYKGDDHHNNSHPAALVPCSISIAKHVKDPDDNEEVESIIHVDDKENFTPTLKSKDSELSEEHPSLLDFKAKCPPGGENAVVLYTTSLRGIRKTFEDCKTIRFLLKSFRVLFHERDVSMHMEYREELWRIMGGRVVPPRLFIKGRYIGGAEEVVVLNEQGKLRKLLEQIPLDDHHELNEPCKGCAGFGFVVCSICNGSCKVFTDDEVEDDDELFIRCSNCNENGLVKCLHCC